MWIKPGALPTQAGAVNSEKQSNAFVIKRHHPGNVTGHSDGRLPSPIPDVDMFLHLFAKNSGIAQTK